MKRATPRPHLAQKFLLQPFWAVIERTPLLVPTGLMAFSVVVTLLLLAGKLQNSLAWPLGIVAALVAMAAVWYRYRSDRPGSTKEQRIFDILVIVGVLLWGVCNIPYTSQQVLTTRDPATYTVTSQWLVDHTDLNIPVEFPFGTHIKGVTPESSGFPADMTHTDRLDAQGLHLLSALLGLAGRVVGSKEMLHLPLVFGMTALLSVYAFARLLVRPRWAFVVTAAFAGSLPLLFFSRGTYTEPLATTFTFGALALFWQAQKQQRYALWLLAGLVLGAGALTRIDGYLSMVAIVLFLAIWIALQRGADRRRAMAQSGLAIVGMAATGLIGWLDLSRLSGQYYANTRPQVHQEFMALALAVVVGLVIIALTQRRTLLTWLDQKTKNWRGPAVACAVIALVLFLASRPMWHIGYAKVQNGLVAAVQASKNVPVVPRNYSELTTQWIAWYLGPLLAILGAAGLAFASARAMVRRDMLLLPGLAVVMLTAALYLVKPSITPDQIWATRRLVPVILPGLAVFGAVVLDWADKEFSSRQRFGYAFAGLAAVAVVLGPLVVSHPFWKVADNAQLPTINAVCRQTPPNAAGFWIGAGNVTIAQTMRTYCNTPAVSYYGGKNIAPSKAVLRQAAKAASSRGYTPVVGLFLPDLKLLSPRDQQHLTMVNSNAYSQLERTLTEPPREVVGPRDTVYMGVIRPDGTIVPLPK